MRRIAPILAEIEGGLVGAPSGRRDGIVDDHSQRIIGQRLLGERHHARLDVDRRRATIDSPANPVSRRHRRRGTLTRLDQRGQHPHDHRDHHRGGDGVLDAPPTAGQHLDAVGREKREKRRVADGEPAHAEKIKKEPRGETHRHEHRQCQKDRPPAPNERAEDRNDHQDRDDRVDDRRAIGADEVIIEQANERRPDRAAIRVGLLDVSLMSFQRLPVSPPAAAQVGRGSIADDYDGHDDQRRGDDSLPAFRAKLKASGDRGRSDGHEQILRPVRDGDSEDGGGQEEGSSGTAAA